MPETRAGLIFPPWQSRASRVPAAYIDSARDRMDPTVLGERLAERDRRQGGAVLLPPDERRSIRHSRWPTAINGGEPRKASVHLSGGGVERYPTILIWLAILALVLLVVLSQALG